MRKSRLHFAATMSDDAQVRSQLLEIISELWAVPGCNDRIRRRKFAIKFRSDAAALVSLPAKTTGQPLLLCVYKEGGEKRLSRTDNDRRTLHLRQFTIGYAIFSF